MVGPSPLERIILVRIQVWQQNIAHITIYLMKGILPNVINLITIFAGFSSFFYFVGYFYQRYYMSAIGLGNSLVNYEYNQLIIVGVTIYLPCILTVFPFIIRKIYIFLYINNAISRIDEGINILKDNSDDINKLKEYKKNYLKFKAKIINDWSSKSVNLSIIIFSIMYISYMSLINYIVLDHVYVWQMVIVIFQILLSYFIYLGLKVVLENDPITISKKIAYYPIAFFSLIMILPLVQAHTSAKFDLKINNFHQVYVVEIDREYNASYIT